MSTEFAVTEHCLNAFKEFKATLSTRELSAKLMQANKLCAEMYKSKNKSIWFKFGSDDTLATTTGEIIHDLNLPQSHSNNKFMLEKINMVIEGQKNRKESLLVYFS